jgi:hypothetical protein
MVVHELRYVLGHGEYSARVLAEHGHGHLGFVQPLLGLLLALVFASVIWQLLRPPAGASRPSVMALWACASAALISIYVIQESAEALVTASHPLGVECVLGHGGWWAIPLSLAVGLGIALALRGADAVVAWAWCVMARRRAASPTCGLRWALVTIVRSPATGIASRLAPRAPPLSASV